MLQEEVVESPEIHFEPVVRLPEVDVKSLEEDEAEIFKMYVCNCSLGFKFHHLFSKFMQNEEICREKKRISSVLFVSIPSYMLASSFILKSKENSMLYYDCVLYCRRAKLFRFDNAAEPPEWKERGTGDVKLLKHKVTGLIRLLMRRDKTHKVCANHYGKESI